MRLSIFLMSVGVWLTIGVESVQAQSSGREVPCPVVVDRTTGKFSSSRSKYRCFNSSRRAKRDGYERHSFSDDSCPAQGSGLMLSGPGERSSVVFTAPNGGVVNYSFPGGGEFEMKVMNASTERRVQELLETESAATGSIAFQGRATPVFVKVEGPGNWTAEVVPNP